MCSWQRTSQLFEDFTAINYKDCFGVKWLKDVITLPTISEARLPGFRPVPPKLQSREEVYLGDETPFECWLYVNSWHSQLIDAVQDDSFFGDTNDLEIKVKHDCQMQVDGVLKKRRFIA